MDRKHKGEKHKEAVWSSPTQQTHVYTYISQSKAEEQADSKSCTDTETSAGLQKEGWQPELLVLAPNLANRAVNY